MIPCRHYLGEITDIHQPVTHGGLSLRNLRNYAAFLGTASVPAPRRRSRFRFRFFQQSDPLSPVPGGMQVILQQTQLAKTEWFAEAPSIRYPRAAPCAPPPTQVCPNNASP